MCCHNKIRDGYSRFPNFSTLLEIFLRIFQVFFLKFPESSPGLPSGTPLDWGFFKDLSNIFWNVYRKKIIAGFHRMTLQQDFLWPSLCITHIAHYVSKLFPTLGRLNILLSIPSKCSHVHGFLWKFQEFSLALLQEDLKKFFKKSILKFVRGFPQKFPPKFLLEIIKGLYRKFLHFCIPFSFFFRKFL